MTLQTNISITVVTGIYYLINMIDAFIIKKMAYYVTMTETYYPASLPTGSTNFWTLANQSLWFNRAIIGIAFLFQALATNGTAKEMNWLVWTYVVFIGLPIGNIIYMTLLYLAYDAAFDNMNIVAASGYTSRTWAMTFTDTMANEFGEQVAL